MKTRIALLIAAMLASLGVTAPAHADPLTAMIDGINYSYSGTTASVIGSDGFSGPLTIPGRITVGGAHYTVTSIGTRAFFFRDHSTVKIPDSVKSIGSDAFNWNKITQLDLGTGVTTIDSGAFSYNSLAEVVIPASVTLIDEYAFHGNAPLANLRFMGAEPTLRPYSFGSGMPRPTVRYPWRFGAPLEPDKYSSNFPNSTMIAMATVSFSNGGTRIPAPATQYVDIDGTSTPTRPADPSVRGAAFIGWFTSPTGGTPFDLNTPVTQDAMAYGRYKATFAGFAPAISGDPREGRMLTARTAIVAPSTAVLSYQWRSNGVPIRGATRSTLKLGKSQAGTKLSVTITARGSSEFNAPQMSKTSASTKLVSSAARRIQVSTRNVAKGNHVTVTATGFKARQKITISLAGKVVHKGRADSRGIVTRTVKFAKKTTAGKQKVTVTSLMSNGKKDKAVSTTVDYR